MLNAKIPLAAWNNDVQRFEPVKQSGLWSGLGIHVQDGTHGNSCKQLSNLGSHGYHVFSLVVVN